MAKTQKLKKKTSALNSVETPDRSNGLHTKVEELEQLMALLMVALARSDAQIAQNEEVFQLAGEYFKVRSAASLELLMNAIKHLPEAPEMIDITPDSLHLACNRFFDQADKA